MTQKEALHYETIQIQNEIRTIQGKAEENINLDTYVDTPNFKKYADRRTKVELEKELAIAKEALKAAQKKAAVEKWLASEEGKEYIQSRKNTIENLYKENREKMEEARAYVSKFIKFLLGEQWDVTRFGDDRMEVAIIDKYSEDGTPVGLFGHEFNVYFGHDWKFTNDSVAETYRWEMNYGTMGSFNLDEDNSTRVQHIIGMGKFAEYTSKSTELKDYLQSLAKELYGRHKLIYNIEKEIKNPVIE